jgi:hypothetical protein
MADATFDVEHFIALDKRYIRILFPFGLLLVVVGVLTLAGIFRVVVHGSESQAIDTITKGGGALVTVIGFFPFSNCYSRWERIQTLRMMKLNSNSLNYESKVELVSKLYAKFLGV